VGQQPVRQDATLASVRYVDELPRSAIGKVLIRELRDAYLAAPSGLG